LLGATNLLEGEALDPYTFARDSYLQRRRQLRYNGAPPPEALDALLDDF
jgi:phospholipid-binding lipoprotein MlaA